MEPPLRTASLDSSQATAVLSPPPPPPPSSSTVRIYRSNGTSSVTPVTIIDTDDFTEEESPPSISPDAVEPLTQAPRADAVEPLTQAPRADAVEPLTQAPRADAVEPLTQAPRVGVFSKMMAKTKTPREWCHLTQDEQGELLCTWGVGASNASAEEVSVWSADLTLGPSKAPTHKLRLTSTLPSVTYYEDNGMWSTKLKSNTGRKGRLSPSLLQSILQKNVRLSRPMPAAKESNIKLSLTQNLPRFLILTLIRRRL